MSAFSLDSIDEGLAQAILSGLGSVEERLAAAVNTEDSIVNTMASHLLNAGGKRIRPVLVYLAGAFGNLAEPSLVDGAALVELTHLATLYHDDVMDSAPTRRGTRSAHTLWGNNAAILTGDFLLARASAMSAELGPHIVKLHAHTFERLCIGQLHETVGPTDTEDPFAHYLSVLSNKTGSLIATSGVVGATLAGADPQIIRIMEQYGEAVGIAFQLADDVIDLRTPANTSGKTPGTDLREGVPTMPTLLLRKAAAAPDASQETLATLAAINADLTSDSALAAAVAALSTHPVVDDTQALANQYADQALQLVAQLPACAARDALELFTTALVRRSA